MKDSSNCASFSVSSALSHRPLVIPVFFPFVLHIFSAPQMFSHYASTKPSLCVLLPRRNSKSSVRKTIILLSYACSFISHASAYNPLTHSHSLFLAVMSGTVNHVISCCHQLVPSADLIYPIA